MMVGRKFLLTFAPAVANQPITQGLWRNFDITVNILKADIDESGGRLVIEIAGESSEISKANEYLAANKVRVEELKNYVRRDTKKCTDCGMCVSICPVKAYVMDTSDYHVIFHLDRCIACGTCLDACPPGALSRGRSSIMSI
ncbi:MAG: NIL domain-containing protein [Methanomassiliicoccales archaeon]|jgi:ferredoxin